MRIEYHKVDTLPPLSWCAQIMKDNDSVLLFHGNQLETAHNYFIEGAWNDHFELGNIINTTIICGTGAALFDNEISFTGSTDRLSPLFSIQQGDNVYISNSPVFAMSLAGEKPDMLYPYYSFDIVRIWRQGTYCLSGKLKTKSSSPLRVHFGTIISINNSLEIKYKTHLPGECPNDYSSYKSILSNGIKRIFENANSVYRNIKCTPISAISRGYDSCATAALASKAGCKDAFTFSNSRNSKPNTDNGAQIAQIMGLDCTVHDRWGYLDKRDLVEAETGIFTFSANTPLSILENDLRNRILVTGTLGDTIWGKKKAAVYGNHSQPWMRHISGLGSIELRLRVGFTIFAPAYISSSFHNKIHQITMSENMSKWSVGGNYDRPIPRRIVEEAGVPRNVFGMVKSANGHVSYNKNKNFTKVGMDSYHKFYNNMYSTEPFLKYALSFMMAYGRNIFWSLFSSSRNRIVSSSKLQRLFPFILNAKPHNIPWKFMFMFQWAFESIKDRYKITDNIIKSKE